MKIILNNTNHIIGFIDFTLQTEFDENTIEVESIPDEVRDNCQYYKYENEEFVFDVELFEQTNIEQLNKLKKEKIQYSKSLLSQFFEKNSLPSLAHNNTLGYYSVTFEKQQLIMNSFQSYQLEKALGLSPTLTWNETGECCEIWTEAEMMQLLLEIKAYVYPVVSKQQHYEKLINSCSSLEELDNMEVTYEEFKIIS